VLLLSRTFYNIYVRGIGGTATKIIAWCSLTFVAGFWTWYLLTGGWST
jgi:hypothetical protein